MALLFGFVMAWILTRTNVPFKRTLDQLMTVPYYVTPLLGRACLELSRRTGKRLRQPALSQARRRRLPHRHHLADGHRLGDGAVRGLRRLRHDQRGHAIDGSGAGRGLAGHGREPMAHDVAGDAAAGGAGRAGRRDLRVRGDAGIVLGRARARHAGALLRHHDGDLSLRVAISAAHSACRRHGRLAVRGDVRHAVALPAHHLEQELRHRQRQGVPATRHGHGRPQMGAVRHLRALCAAVGAAAGGDADVRGACRSWRWRSRPRQFHARQFPPGVLAQRRAHRHGEQPDPRRRDRHARRRHHRPADPDHPAQPSAGPRRARISRHVPAGRAASRLRVRHDVGLAGVPAADLRARSGCC